MDDGLSVCSMNSLPCMNLLNFFLADMMANASFSIWLYRFSAAIIDLQAWNIGLVFPSPVCCNHSL